MLDILREVFEGADIVPQAFAAYRPLILDGLLFFLARLPEDRRDAMLAEQFEIEGELDADERVIALLRRCPTLHKLAQVIGHDKGLPLELRTRLQTLESLPPSADLAEVNALLRAELGETPGVEIASEALAEGSVAIVVPFLWTTPSESQPVRGVLKIIKPHVERRLLEELDIWDDLGTYLEERAIHYGLPPLRFGETLRGVRTLLLSEVRLDLEQKRLTEARRFYSGDARIVIPRVLPMSTPRMTAMEFVDGRKITEPGPDAERRRDLARTAIDALLAKPFWDKAEEATFHADTHAGNLLVTSDGRLAIIDWALTTVVSGTQRNAIVQALLGAATLNASLVFESLAELGRVVDATAVHTAIRVALRDVRRGAFPGFAWLTGLLDELAATATMHFPEETTLFRKSMLTLQGVAEDVSGRVSVDDVLVQTGIAAFASDLPLRPLAPVDSRAFASRVSNLDLLLIWATLPQLPLRFWLGVYGDVLTASRSHAPISRGAS